MKAGRMTSVARRMGRSAWVTIALCAALGLSGCDRGPQEVRIGIAMPLSGPLGEEGRSMVRAAELAAEEINQERSKLSAGRIQVRVVSADDQGDDQMAPKAAQQLVDQRVSAVIGHLTSGASIAAAPVYGAADVPQLAFATHPRYTQLGLSTTFRLVASDALQAQALARYVAKELPDRGIAVIDDSSVYGKGLADLVAADLAAQKRELTYRRSYAGTATDFADLAAAVKESDVVVTTMEMPQVRLVLQHLRDAGRRDVVVIGGDSVKAGQVPPEAGETGRLLATTPVTDVREFGAAGAGFVDRYRAKYKSPPADAAHYVFDAVHLLVQAAAAQQSGEPAKLRAALPGFDPAVPITSYLRFAPGGELRYGAVGLYAATKGEWRLVARSTEW